jgi:tetratricopeptide (TPR) repeat protein
MSQSNVQVSETNISNSEAKKIKPLRAYTIIISFTVIMFIIGIMVGKFFFWNNYNRTPKAERQINANLEKLHENPKDPKVLTDLGWAYFKQNNYNQALIYYMEALDQDKNYYPAHLNLGLAYTQVQKYDLAIQSFKDAISISPKGASAHLNLGIVYNLIQKYQDAASELAIADKSNPGNVETMYQLGLAYEKLESFKDAAYQYESALKFDPKYTQAKEGLDRVKDKVKK